MTSDRHVLDVTSPHRWAGRAADVVAAAMVAAVDQRERCLVALSGGSSPTEVFKILAHHDEVPWERIIFLQVDERIVPLDSSARNLMSQRSVLGHLGASWLPLPVDELLALRGRPPVSHEPPRVIDAERARPVLDRFAQKLVTLAGDPPVLDLVHLGLGADGHTASLVPGDPLVDELRRYVGVTGLYSGSPSTGAQQQAALDPKRRTRSTQRISLTRPVLDRARMVLWLVRGSSKSAVLARLLDGDMSIPAGLIHPAHSVVVADSDAATGIADPEVDPPTPT